MLKKAILYTLLNVIISASWAQDSVKISGKLLLDSSWTPIVYVSKIRDLSDLYLSAEHLIMAQAKVEQNGQFEVIISPNYDGHQLVRLHVSLQGDPAATLIIDGVKENHGFYAIAPGKELRLDFPKENRLFNHFHANGMQNMQLRTVDEIIEIHELVLHNADRDNREKLVTQVIDQLYHFSDTSSFILPACYALIKSDYGFNRETFLSKMTSLEERLGKHPYLNPFIFKSSNTQLQTGLSLAVTALILGIWAIYKYRRRKLEQKIHSLSPQERKVATLLISGKSNKEIAGELHVEISTVKSHIYKLFNKLGIDLEKKYCGIKATWPRQYLVILSYLCWLSYFFGQHNTAGMFLFFGKKLYAVIIQNPPTFFQSFRCLFLQK